MEDPRWLRLLTVGLVLAALAVGYFLFTGKFSTSTTKKETQVSRATPTTSPSATLTSSPAPVARVSPSPTPTSTPVSAYSIVANRTKGGAQTLPSTGFPVGLTVALSVSVMIVGFGLRRFPH